MKEVDLYIEKKKEWRELLILLRNLLTNLELEETIKWGSPVYTNKGKNIVGLAAFKSYVGLWFFQGATLVDAQKKLINAQEGKTSAMRQWRFSSKETLDVEMIVSYVKEAIDNQVNGKVILPKKNLKPVIIPELLAAALKKDKDLGNQFSGFSLSKQREFADYISEAKRISTKELRLAKIIPMILEGKGLHDAYR
ncbi:hypothetical protein GCM10011416_23800 [Polaribacter pacificus]|uniref:YdhG-like domain-containing protein n=1 Tax=Polaribacter pacificus TaxID=1775173 RepID=A0A917I1Q3_9FLAO|nr:DUF1801 domain-containing protein [Polaribacter pacificus]GGH03937.1 hypothetical protein GCM10011416_23800 [Polaribacter pacificus]